MDAFGGLELKKLFKIDKVHHDNWLFKLHHQVNFFVILVGVVFIFGENYLNGKAIVCKGGDDYSNQYCWLHGTGHLHQDLAKDITGLCAMDQGEVTKKNDRQTHYYLWLPFLLAICMGMVKMPRVIWKNLCERGIMSSLAGDGTQMGEKIAARFKKLKKRSASLWYHVCFAVCEVLNIVMLLVCFHIMDSLLNGRFWSYGIDVNNYYGSKPTEEALKSNPDLAKPNPMCNLFPTEVACNLCTGSIGGGCNDKSSILCILSNNLFNQYFFLILWFWWVFLLFISILGLIYRAAQMSIPAVSKAVFQSYLTPYGLDYTVSKLSLRPSDYFLLGRLAINVKGSTMEDVINELLYTKGSEENEILTTTA
eukprot:TRINITY_DN19927_c0_g1_i1.p1 TRINITY_DN19927_c0_g1~~TRINITY_DN19927_c0_g1_i1.p1  ORF type:complete len:384 (-),score=92.99 TRINITY_DN19927_c0_g1_i1:37-1131(-)